MRIGASIRSETVLALLHGLTQAENGSPIRP